MALNAVARTARVVLHAKRLIASRDPKNVALVKDANEAFSRIKLLTPGAVHNDATLATLSVQYRNEDYIGTDLMPVATVPKLSDKYAIYAKGDRIGDIDDSVGARSTPNEVNEHRSFSNYSCQPYALTNFLDALTLANEDAPLNEMVDLVAAINDRLEFRREVRIASVLTTAANFPGQTVALTGSDRWDSGSGGDPIKVIEDAASNIWMGAGNSVLRGYADVETWKVISRHPAIRELFKYQTNGLAKPAQVAEYFGLESIRVGKAWKQGANEGQTASYSRVWGKCFGIVRVSTIPTIRNAAFGYTMRFGNPTSSQWWDPKPGTRGGYYAKTGLEECHQIVASDTGYLITTPIS